MIRIIGVFFFIGVIITVKWNGVVGLRVLPTHSFSVKENSSSTLMMNV